MRPNGYWAEAENQRAFMDALAEKFDVKKAEDWKRVRVKDAMEVGGGGLLKRHGNSFFALLADTYPERGYTELQCRSKVPQGYWKSAANRRSFMDHVAALHGIEAAEDWGRKKVTRREVTAMGGHRLLGMYSYSLPVLLADVYPEEDFSAVEGLLPNTPAEAWASQEHRQEFLAGVAKKFNVREPSDWQHVLREDIVAMGGSGLLRRYGSIRDMLLDNVAGMREWEEGVEHGGCRLRQAKGHWKERENRLRFLRLVEKKYGIEKASDWKQVKVKDLQALGGGGLLASYGGSITKVLLDTYEGLEETDCRQQMPTGYWEKKENRRRFMDGIAKELGVQGPRDWAAVPVKEVMDRNGSALLSRYNYSLFDALKDLYPEVTDEEVFLFRNVVPRSFWREEDNVRQFLLSLKESLGVRSIDDWGRVSVQQVRDHNGNGLLEAMPLRDALRLAFPKERWGSVEFVKSQGKRSAQRQLFVMVRSLLEAPRAASSAAVAL